MNMTNLSTDMIEGVLELGAGGGFLRNIARGLKPAAGDAQVGSALIARHRLRSGAWVAGRLEPRRGPVARLAEIVEIERRPVAELDVARGFDDLTPIDPRLPIRLETGAEPIGPRLIDLFTPIGKGQRGLIVAPPRSGKTILLQQIADAVVANHPEIELIVLLIDERPEEVSEFRRTIKGGDVLASSLDHSTEEHVRLAELAIERGKRIAESGGDVLILLDSLTRLARAYNKHSSTGRTMSGGVDIRALDVPKRLFGAARAFEEGGSLTVLASVLIETGSRMDDVIFQEFKGTGNMELVLDRKLAERRVWPAIDIQQSGTRKEERLLDSKSLASMTSLRRGLSALKPDEAMESLVERLPKYPTNAIFLDKIGDVLAKAR